MFLHNNLQTSKVNILYDNNNNNIMIMIIIIIRRRRITTTTTTIIIIIIIIRWKCPFLLKSLIKELLSNYLLP